MEEIYGDPATVIRRIVQQMVDGSINAEQAAELVKAMAQPNEGVDVTVGFRVALISQGYETEALKLNRVRMHLVEAGAMFNYSIPAAEEDWLDGRHEELDPVFLRASIMVLRAGNIDATLDDSEPNMMRISGEINPTNDDDIDEVVGLFRQELDDVFPDQAPHHREGKWW